MFSKPIFFSLMILMFVSCQNGEKGNRLKKEESKVLTLPSENKVFNDTLVLSKQHHPDAVFCDLDGDNLSDTVKIVRNTKNSKYGLKISFGNKKVTNLGAGEEFLGQGFDDLSWIGVFEKAPKGSVYWNTIDDGEITADIVLDEKNKIKLANDGIFIHQAESCGGGVIYLKNGKFQWIQQE